MRRQITLAEVLDAVRFAENAARYSSMPGIVQAYYPGQLGVRPATVDVQPAVQDVRLDTDTGALVFEPWPVIPKVPIAYPRGGGRSIWFPLAQGDDVQLVAHDLDPGVFRATGQHAKPVLTRRNSGCHWWAYPGSIADPNGLPDPGQAICIGTPGGVMVTIDGAHVNLGAAAPTDFVALASKVDSNFVLVKTLAAALGAGALTVVAGYTAPQSAAVASACTAISSTPGFSATGSLTVKCQP